MTIGQTIENKESREIADLAGRMAARVYDNASPQERRTAMLGLGTEALSLVKQGCGDPHPGFAADLLVMALGLLYRFSSGSVTAADLEEFRPTVPRQGQPRHPLFVRKDKPLERW